MRVLAIVPPASGREEGAMSWAGGMFGVPIIEKNKHSPVSWHRSLRSLNVASH